MLWHAIAFENRWTISLILWLSTAKLQDLYSKGHPYPGYPGYVMMSNMNDSSYMNNGSLSPPMPRTVSHYFFFIWIISCIYFMHLLWNGALKQTRTAEHWHYIYNYSLKTIEKSKKVKTFLMCCVNCSKLLHIPLLLIEGQKNSWRYSFIFFILKTVFLWSWHWFRNWFSRFV